jgi:hypothetical protein
VLDDQGKNTILRLRLLIARAAQKDSLAWWEDDSLTPAGGYLLERLFPTDPGEAGRRLALEAARTRCRAALAGQPDALHLFRLDRSGEIDHSLQGMRLSDLPLPAEPIPSLEALRQELLALGGPPVYRVLGERAGCCLGISLKAAGGRPAPVESASSLAWAFLEGAPGSPIFPYLQPGR